MCITFIYIIIAAIITGMIGIISIKIIKKNKNKDFL